jgi:lipopolysaccharide biosynthesis glycosyltransferase
MLGILMTGQQDETLIAFGVDVNYAPHLGVTIASIVANAPGGRFRFLVIHDGFPEAQRALVEACAPQQVFQWEEVRAENILSQEGYRHISRAAFFRLTIPELAPVLAKRAIYLDVDLVVLDDIRILAASDLNGNALGAVFDPVIDPHRFAGTHGLAPVLQGYFNSGVLVLDLERIRSDRSFEAAIKIITDQGAKLEYADQCALNIVFWGKWTRLDPVWNGQRPFVRDDDWMPIFVDSTELQRHRRVRIVHYTTHHKPWLPQAYHPLSSFYFRYLKRTPFRRSADAARGSIVARVRRYLKAQLYLARRSD